MSDLIKQCINHLWTIYSSQHLNDNEIAICLHLIYDIQLYVFGPKEKSSSKEVQVILLTAQAQSPYPKEPEKGNRWIFNSSLDFIHKGQHPTMSGIFIEQETNFHTTIGLSPNIWDWGQDYKWRPVNHMFNTWRLHVKLRKS